MHIFYDFIVRFCYARPERRYVKRLKTGAKNNWHNTLNNTNIYLENGSIYNGIVRVNH